MTVASSPRILILDDEMFTLRLITHMLNNLGFAQVTSCGNGHDALAIVDSADAPDIILCDLNMPRMDGIQFLRKLADHDYAGSLIFISGESERMLWMSQKLAQAHRITFLGHLKK